MPMTRLLTGLALTGLALTTVAACTMTNPAFEGGDELADDAAESSTQSDTTTQGEVGETSTTAPGTTDATSDTSTTIGSDCDPNESTSCGECMTCTPSGTCVAASPGTPCEGEVIHCEQYAYGLLDGVCYALQPDQLSPKCTESGECKQPEPGNCLVEKGEPVLACDTRCVTNPDVCALYEPIVELELDDMCKLDGETELCGPFCSIFDEIVKSSCSSEGWCMDDYVEACLYFACNPETAECFTECDTNLECTPDAYCVNDPGTCVPYFP